MLPGCLYIYLSALLGFQMALYMSCLPGTLPTQKKKKRKTLLISRVLLIVLNLPLSLSLFSRVSESIQHTQFGIAKIYRETGILFKIVTLVLRSLYRYERRQVLSLEPRSIFEPNMAEIPGCCAMDFSVDIGEFLLDEDPHACTHIHTCNPPGPDFSHTHTCFHAHTKVVPSLTEDKAATDDTVREAEKKTKKRPLGNQKAVRKYREKKKAEVASLEEEVKKLRAKNQQLLKRLQGQVALEAEIARLKCLLVDFRVRIEGEIGSFPYQKPANPNLPGAYVMNPCNMQCDDQVYCLHPGMEGKSGEGAALNCQGFSCCDPGNFPYLANSNSGLKELPGVYLGNVVSTVNTSTAN